VVFQINIFQFNSIQRAVYKTSHSSEQIETFSAGKGVTGHSCQCNLLHSRSEFQTAGPAEAKA